MLIARFDETTGRRQTLREHSENVSRRCGENLAAIGLDAVGRLVGLVHDLGKAKPEFQYYIGRAACGENVERGSVVHSTAGMCYLASLVESDGKHPALNGYLAELCEFAVGAHHGVFDCVDLYGQARLFKRMDAEPDFDETVRTFFAEVPRPDDETILAANEQFAAAVAKMRISESDGAREKQDVDNEQKFYIGMLARLVLSALVDADRRDSADFCAGRTETKPPAPIKEMAENCERFVADLESRSSGRIDEVRSAISRRVAEAGKCPPGAYRLNVPCGAGKTIASIRFALTHAGAHGKRRIFYVAPLLTILDQNVAVIRNLVGGDERVLEHTSDFDERSIGEEEAKRRRLATEDWSSPVIATSLVRFLETLFSANGSAIRRMNSLAQSVIILDEVQSVPVRSITMFNAAINFLTRVAGATVLLCTATLPESPDLAASVACRPAVVITEEEQEVFRRCRVISKGDEFTYDELTRFILSVMAGTSRLLVICNTKREAAQLFRILAASGRDAEKPFSVVHLSAAMCKAHRGKVLERISSRDERLVCVSTQVVEAGVDVSFECVIRLAAGIDNVAQAAGRCNRSGEYGGTKDVYVVRLKDEKLGSLSDIRRAREAFDRATVGKESFDPADTELIAEYYREFYRSATDKKNETLYPAKVDGIFVRLYDLLSANSVGTGAGQYGTGRMPCLLQQAFLSAGKTYRAIEEDTCAVIVPYDDRAREIIADLYSARAKNDFTFASRRIKDTMPYVISVRKRKLEELVCGGAAQGLEVFDRIVYILGEGEYDPNVGLLDENTIL